MKTIITGCDLLLPDGRINHGDLWTMPGAYVFNGVTRQEERDQPLWQESLAARHIRILPQHEYWMRRGIFIIPVDSTVLSPEATFYVAKWR